MKLTNLQLNQIIQEELEDFMLDEGVWDKFKGAVGLGPDPDAPSPEQKAKDDARRAKNKADHAERVAKNQDWQEKERERKDHLKRATRATSRRISDRDAAAYQRKREKEAEEESKWRRSRDSPHRANPGQAGTANLGYGEGVERAKLEKIIREELNGMLK